MIFILLVVNGLMFKILDLIVLCFLWDCEGSFLVWILKIVINILFLVFLLNLLVLLFVVVVIVLK